MRVSRKAGAASALALAAASPAQAKWVASFAAPPSPPLTQPGPFKAPSYDNVTLRQVMRLSEGGDRLRVRFTNRYGEQPLKIGAARIALLDKDGHEIAGSARTLTFSGSGSAVIPVGAPYLSDAVKLDVPDLAVMRLDIYLPEETGPCSCHLTAIDTQQVSPSGNHVGEDFAPASTSTQRGFVMSVEVDSPNAQGTIAAFGDSITDGLGSSGNQFRRWPDYLAASLSGSGQNWGVANLGISGNHVLAGGAGEAALARFDSDVLGLPNVRWVILFEAVNDLGTSFMPKGGRNPMAAYIGNVRPITADEIIAAYRQMIARAHEHGIKVIGATITPYKETFSWSEQGEAARQKINAFIRESGAFDSVVDFDAAWRDPVDPARIRDGYYWDHIHGSDEGYEVLANTFDLSLFKAD